MDWRKSDLCEALPQQGRASRLVTSFNESLLESFGYLFDACSGVLPSSLLTQSQDVLQALSPDQKLSGFLSLIHTELYKAVESDEPQKAQQLLEKLIQLDLPCDKLRYLSYTDVDAQLAPLLLHLYTCTLPLHRLNQVDPRPLAKSDFRRMCDAFDRGFAVLKKVSPALYKESREIISEILFFSSPELRGGSSFDLFGMVYFNFMFKWEKLTDTLDLITHEQAHLYVFLLNSFDTLVHNGTEFHKSPLRAESERPLMGIYHAGFVMARITHVLVQALEGGHIPLEEENYCRSQIENYQGRYVVALDVLHEHAKMTPLAAGLLESSMDLVGLQKPLAS